MAAPTKLISASQPFQSPQGAVVALGFIRLTLSTVAEVISGGGQVTTQPLILALDANGKLTATAIWFNDELTPSGTVYHVELLGSNGCLLINDFGFASVTGASFDLATAVFSGAPSGPTFSGAVLLTPTGNQTITTGNLTLSTGNFTTTAGSILSGTTVTATTKVTAGGTAATGSASGDITAARSTTIGQLYLGTDGNGWLFRSGNTVQLSGSTFTATFPVNTGTVAELNLAQAWTATQTFSSPVINGTPTGTGIPTITLKKGSGGGNYTSTSTSYVQVDATNLLYTVTIPTGWKLHMVARGDMTSSTLAVNVGVILADGGATIAECQITPAVAGTVAAPFVLTTVVNGDGASHTIDLRFKTSNAADAVVLANVSVALTPMITFILSPSN